MTPEPLYFHGGVWGGFRLRSPRVPQTGEGAVSHILDEWGLPAPWAPCDSGVDFTSPGENLLRGWAQVDLRYPSVDEIPEDVPTWGLLRTISSALELFGDLRLTALSAIVPLDALTSRTWGRVSGSTIIRDPDRTTAEPPKVLLQAGDAWTPAPKARWKPRQLRRFLAELLGGKRAVRTSEERLPLSSPIPHPFSPAPPPAFRAELLLPQWTVDDAAWLVEALAVACRESGITTDVEIIVARIDGCLEPSES